MKDWTFYYKLKSYLILIFIYIYYIKNILSVIFYIKYLYYYI